MKYLVKQHTFEGPLDLLLQLIEAAELDITTISLAEVTEDYLAHVKELEQQHLADISDWLVIAARLVLLKSRALLPEEAAEEEPADDLAAQLAEYAVYKKAASLLGEQFASTRFSAGKQPSDVELAEQLVTDGVDVPGLYAAWQKVLAQIPEQPLRITTIDDQLTIDQCITQITKKLRRGPTAFEQLFTALASRIAMIVTFLAVLELVKQQLLAVSIVNRGVTVSLRSGPV